MAPPDASPPGSNASNRGAPQEGFSADVVRRAQGGDQRARTALFEAAEPVLQGYFIKRIGKNAAVDDLVQNTLVRLHEGLADLKKPGSLKAFLMKAALFELQDYYRGRYDMKEILYDPDVPPERTGGAHLEARRAGSIPAEEEMDVERALAVLSDKARRIIELREYGYRYKEIARLFDTTEAAVKMQVKRAFDKMRDALAVFLVALAAAAGAL